MFLFRSIAGIFPRLKSSDILSAAIVKRFVLLSEIAGYNAVVFELFSDSTTVQANWTQNRYVQAFQDLTTNGGKRILGPLLVVKGNADPIALPQATTSTVNRAGGSFPDTQSQYVTYTGVTHVPAMFASQLLWFDWIAECYAGAHMEKGCHTFVITSARPYSSYQKGCNWILSRVT